MDIPLLQRRLKPALVPLSACYAGLMALRRRAYESGWKSAWRPPCPVVSVGNIGWGGSGKTPLCGHILRWAGKREEHALVLTRGYGAKPKRLPLLVTKTSDPAQCGDEPLLLARGNPQARVVVDPVRSRSGPWGFTRFDPDFVLLDDGFQHLAVARDLDLLLLTGHDLGEGWGRVQPAGTWREGPSALARADAFLVKADPERTPQADILLRLGDFGLPAYVFSLKPTGLMRLDGTARAADLGGEDYVLATGIGAPEQAAATALALLGRPPREILAFPDHHPFAQADVLRILTAAAGAHVLVTAKDGVKLSRLSGTEAFWTLRTELQFGTMFFTQTPFDAWFAGRFAELAEHWRAQAAQQAQA